MAVPASPLHILQHFTVSFEIQVLRIHHSFACVWFAMLIVLLALAFANCASMTLARSVFAHVVVWSSSPCFYKLLMEFKVGTTYSYTQANWASDISRASGAGIDGFALNIGYQDTINSAGFVQTQLRNAYNAADAAGNFKLFFSFDYQAQGAWDKNTVINTIVAYSSRASQFKVGNKSLVSTFEGPSNAADWSTIKSQAQCLFMPDYSSLGATGAAAAANVDGLLSWDAWPNGANNMTENDDKAYVSALAGRPYIMPVSPWFYTNLPAYSKNWLWRGDNLWHDRWQQVLDINPPYVEILTWNDWGESSYIGPLPPSTSAYPSGSQTYVQSNPHEAWLKDVPHYVAQYKNVTRPKENHVTFWYRLNPGLSGSNAGTTCNTASYQTTVAPQLCDTDAVFFTAFVSNSAIATVRVTIGGQTQSVTAKTAGIFHSSVPFNNIGNGSVSVSVNATDGTKIGPITGASITNNCVNGNVNWNAWVGGS